MAGADAPRPVGRVSPRGSTRFKGHDRERFLQECVYGSTPFLSLTNDDNEHSQEGLSLMKTPMEV